MRKNEVTFSITEAATTQESSERAHRLALFLSTIRERPEVFPRLVDSHKTVTGFLAAAEHPEVQRYGAEQDYRDGYTFDIRALFATAQILQHEDDLEVDFDKETSEALQKGLAARRALERAAEVGNAEIPRTDWRIERIGIVASALGDIRPDFDGNEAGVDISRPVTQLHEPPFSMEQDGVRKIA